MRAIQGNGQLGKLDSNHDIARAALVAQTNACLHLISSAAGTSTSVGDIAHYNRATRKLQDVAADVLKDDFDFVSLLAASKESPFELVKQSVDALLDKEGAGAAVTRHGDLAESAYAATVKLGGWPDDPAHLRGVFLADGAFADAFDASLGALFKDDDWLAFFNIWQVLQQAATRADLAALTQHVAALQVAPSEEMLATMEAQYTGLLTEIRAVKKDTEEIKGTTARTESNTEEILALVKALGPGVLDKAYKAHVQEKAILELARRTNEKVRDFDQALAELDRLVAVATDLAESGEQGTNLGDIVDRVVKAVAEKSETGDYDGAAEEVERALAEINDRREELAAQESRVLETGLKVDILRRYPDAAAARDRANGPSGERRPRRGVRCAPGPTP